MAAQDDLATLRRMPAVHCLVSGAFLQGTVWIDDRTVAVPLTPLGFECAASFAVRYNAEVLGVPPEDVYVKELINQGARSQPVIALVFFPEHEGAPTDMEAVAKPRLDRAAEVLSWLSGDASTAFAFTVATRERNYFRLLPRSSRHRMRLGLGNTGHDNTQRVRSIVRSADDDERYAFALSQYKDALHEPNQLFQVARLFSVLEALAYALKGENVGSRTAIRKMLGVDPAVGQLTSNGQTIRYERIELAGRLRDRIFHGARFEETDLSVDWRHSFRILTDFRDHLIQDLMADCELEFAKWANNYSVARTAAEEKRKASTDQ